MPSQINHFYFLSQHVFALSRINLW